VEEGEVQEGEDTQEDDDAQEGEVQEDDDAQKGGNGAPDDIPQAEAVESEQNEETDEKEGDKEEDEEEGDKEKTDEEETAEEEEDIGEAPSLPSALPGSATGGIDAKVSASDTEMPDDVLSSIINVWLYLPPRPKILTYTFNMAPSINTQNCFKDELKARLSPIWKQVFTAGANGLPMPPISSSSAFPDLPSDYTEPEEEVDDTVENPAEKPAENSAENSAENPAENQNTDTDPNKTQIEEYTMETTNKPQQGGDKHVVYR
jgi:hypothetical protein